MTLQELQQEENRLTELLTENRLKQREINTKAFCEKWGVNIGDTIEWVDGRKTHIGVVSHLDYSGVKPNNYIVNPLTKDGKRGKRESRIWFYSFQTIKLISKA